MPPAAKWEAISRHAGDNSPSMSIANDSSGFGAIFANPENTNTQEPKPIILRKTRFRSKLIQGVVHDNYPLTFGEGPGMIEVFRLANPEIKPPSHQTMRRDLRELYLVLSKRAPRVIQSTHAETWDKSKINVASIDPVTGTDVEFMRVQYSLAGVVVSFIDDSWTLYHLPIDIIHLDAKHSGAAMGKKAFKSTHRRGIGSNLFASVTDNASNNHTMNEEIARRFMDKFGVDLNVDNMTITCVAHAIHLVCG
ncbi:hypothetical protein FRC07_015156 [Ceratobasidium sp. 392]|nr:hypothetical protein FRC07_015156 [Ceratobasidium sp. 392]